VIWIVLQRGAADWKYIKAEPPCQKGEVRFSLLLIHGIIGWQSRKERR